MDRTKGLTLLLIRTIEQQLELYSDIVHFEVWICGLETVM